MEFVCEDLFIRLLMRQDKSKTGILKQLVAKHTSMDRIVEMMSQMSELILLYIVGEYTSGVHHENMKHWRV
ncbi:hypothetical protein AZ66_30390 [Paenibacillus sp. E194]|nr:hypothetical protein AZ66_30390 [Paenibacillus sp. E194]